TSVLLRLTERRAATTRYAIACVSLVAMLAVAAATATLTWTAVGAPHGTNATLKGGAAPVEDAALNGRATPNDAGLQSLTVWNTGALKGRVSGGWGKGRTGSAGVARRFSDAFTAE